MKRSDDAETAVGQVPFFVGKKVCDFLDLYKARSTHGQRFAPVLTDADVDRFSQRWKP